MKNTREFLAGTLIGIVVSFFFFFLIQSLMPAARHIQPPEGLEKSVPSASKSISKSRTAPYEAGHSLAGLPALGSAQSPVTIVEYADFHCIHCRRLSPRMKQLLFSYPSSVRWVFHPFPIFGSPGGGSFVTHEAALCADEQKKFWEFHDRVFKFPGIPTRADLDAIAAASGMDVPSFSKCLTEERYREKLNEFKAQGSAAGIRSTPTILINGKLYRGAKSFDFLQGAVEAVLQGRELPDSDRPASSPSPSAARPEPREPERIVSFDDLDGKPARGAVEPRITIVEFSDFHCPFCRKAAGTLDRIHEEFGESLRHVSRHFPLSQHRGADRTHAASECAHDQGKFWEFRKHVFERDSVPVSDDDLAQVARDAGLSEKKFKACMESGNKERLVAADKAAGDRAGVRGTPAFFLNGVPLSGNVPYEEFRARILKILNPEKDQ